MKHGLLLAWVFILGCAVPVVKPTATRQGPQVAQSAYEKALASYWREDNVQALEQFQDVLDHFPTSEQAKRAGYLMEIIWEQKLRRSEMATLAERWRQTHPELAMFASAVHAETQQDWNLAAQRLMEFVVIASADGSQMMGIRRLCGVLGNATTCEMDMSVLVQTVKRMRELDFHECTDPVRTYAYRTVLRDKNPDRASARAEFHRLFYQWSGELNEAAEAVRAYYDASEKAEGRRCVDEAIARQREEFTAYLWLSQVMAEKGDTDSAVALLRQGLRNVQPSQEQKLRQESVAVCQRWWRHMDALELLEDASEPHTPETTEQIRQLREAFGGRYLPEKSLPIAYLNGQIARRQDGSFLVVQATQDEPVASVMAPDGKALKCVKVPCEGQWQRRVIGTAFGVFPDGSFLFDNLHLSEDGMLIGRFPVSSPLMTAAISDKGELLAVDSSKGCLWLFDAQGKCVLTNSGPQGLGWRVIAVGFCETGFLLANHNEVFCYDKKGQLSGKLTGMKAGDDLENVGQLLSDKQGLIYASVGKGMRRRIHVFRPDLRFSHTLDFHDQIKMFTVDQEGAVYVTGNGGTVKFVPTKWMAPTLTHSASSVGR